MTTPDTSELRKQVILKLGYIRFEQGIDTWQRVEHDVIELITQSNNELLDRLEAKAKKYATHTNEHITTAVPLSALQEERK